MTQTQLSEQHEDLTGLLNLPRHAEADRAAGFDATLAAQCLQARTAPVGHTNKIAGTWSKLDPEININ